MFKKIKVKCKNKYLANKKHFIKHLLTRLKVKHEIWLILQLHSFVLLLMGVGKIEVVNEDIDRIFNEEILNYTLK